MGGAGFPCSAQSLDGTEEYVGILGLGVMLDFCFHLPPGILHLPEVSLRFALQVLVAVFLGDRQ